MCPLKLYVFGSGVCKVANINTKGALSSFLTLVNHSELSHSHKIHDSMSLHEKCSSFQWSLFQKFS